MTKPPWITPIAAIIGLALGIATLDAQQVSVISDLPVLGWFQEILVYTLVPGLVSSALGGSLWIGFFINGIFYFCLVWAVGTLWNRWRGASARRERASQDPLG
jgi:hypothetical protein